MSVVLVEGISDQVALEAAARLAGRDLALDGVEVVPIGGAQAIGRVAATYERRHVVGLCDAPEERWFRRVLGESTFVCVENLEDELIRALGLARIEEILEREGDLEPFRTFQRQPAWRGRPPEAQLRRWLHAADRRSSRYPPLLVGALAPEQLPRPLAGVLAAVA